MGRGYFPCALSFSRFRWSWRRFAALFRGPYISRIILIAYFNLVALSSALTPATSSGALKHFDGVQTVAITGTDSVSREDIINESGVYQSSRL